MAATDGKHYLFTAAGADDTDHVLALYRSVSGGDFCTWNEFYPGFREITADYASGNLFVLRDDGRIIGAISIVPENELDELDFWRRKEGKIAEIARVAIAPGYQGKGLALHMVYEIEKILMSRDYCAVHLLAALTNIPACRTYQKAGYQRLGECDMYGHRFCVYEKSLDIVMERGKQ